MHFFRESIDGRITQNENVATRVDFEPSTSVATRAPSLVAEASISAGFHSHFHLYDFSIHIVDPAHPNFRIPRYVSDIAASLASFCSFFLFFFFSYLVARSFFDNPICRSSIFRTGGRSFGRLQKRKFFNKRRRSKLSDLNENDLSYFHAQDSRRKKSSNLANSDFSLVAKTRWREEGGRINYFFRKFGFIFFK